MKEGTIPKGRIITLASLGFIAGTGIFSFTPRISTIYFIISLLVVLFIFFSVCKKYYWPKAISIIVIGLCLAGWRYSLSYPIIDASHISSYNGKKFSFSGIISDEPTEKPAGQQLVVAVNGAMDGKALISAPPYPRYTYGDHLAIECKLEKPESKEFAYDRYLARYHIYSLCSRPKIKVLNHNQGSRFRAMLIRLKQQSYRIAQAYMPEPTASLALPVVFGGGQGIDDDITDDFRRTGLTHIMAVSGFNVSLLAALLGFGLFGVGLGRRAAFYVSSLVIAAYIIMVGAPASAVRAGVMSVFLLLALAVGRLASLPRSVLLVAITTLLVNPRLLRDDIGWQLSFLALLGLMYILPYLEKWSFVVTKGKYKVLITALMATIAAQLATAPVILYNFGQFSVIAPFANLLVVWIIPILTISMMAALPLAALFPSLGGLLFFPSWLMVKYIFLIVEFLSGFSWAALNFST